MVPLHGAHHKIINKKTFFVLKNMNKSEGLRVKEVENGEWRVRERDRVNFLVVGQ